MKTIRIGSGAGYGGDRIEPAIDLIKNANLDYIAFECLAERTIALAQLEKAEDPAKGYNPLLEYRMKYILPAIKEHPVKVITNMGAANPVAAAEKIAQMAKEAGLSNLKIAAITGDDITYRLNEFYDKKTMETNKKLSAYKNDIISANAYMGSRPIVEALSKGADIIVTGRVADPALFAAPLIYEFNKGYDDYDFLGKATVVGHLLECAGQVTGGYFADPGYKDVPDLYNLGFPFIDVNENGDIVVSKLNSAGGKVTVDTVKEQLIYEIQDPCKYLTPDVIADFSNVSVKQSASNKVQVSNATGHKKTGLLKVSVGYKDGYIAEAGISYGGHNAAKRAKLAADIVKKRLEMRNLSYDEIRFDLLGVNSLYEDVLPQYSPNEVRLRVAAKTKSKEYAKEIGNEVEALYTNGPSAGGGVRCQISKIVSIISILVPETVIEPKIIWKGAF